MNAHRLTDAELALLFPRGHRLQLEQYVYRLTRLLKLNRNLLLRAERPIVERLIADWIEQSKIKTALNQAHILAEDVLEQVRVNWPAVAYPLGIDPIADAVELARSIPPFPPAPPDYGPLHAEVFRTVYWLNVAALKAQRPTWFASTHALAKALGAHQMLVYRTFRRLEREGYIKASETGNTHKATRYETRLVDTEEHPHKPLA